MAIVMVLLNASNDICGELMSYDRKLPAIEFHWENERIWGATAFMVLYLKKILLKQ